METPKVSVCVPSYNAAPYLANAIDSALRQHFASFEVVVSDDASSDRTPEICAHYSDPRFRVVRSDDRLGQAGNWNRCLELARGEYVILLHADDELMPGYLKGAAAVLDAHDDVGLVHCAVEHVDEEGMPFELQRLFQDDVIDRNGSTLRRLLLDGCVISPAGVMVRKVVYDHVGPFTSEIVWGVDWHMWTRIALSRPIAYIARPLAKYREHGQSGTSSVMTSGRNARDEEWMFDDLFRQIARSRPELSELREPAVRGIAHRTWCFAEEMCKVGDVAAARIGLRNAVRIWPGMLAEPRTWGLWIATYAGYGWFARLHTAKQLLSGG
jgi:glycosyltransferase involved in cell wall biosynthesis